MKNVKRYEGRLMGAANVLRAKEALVFIHPKLIQKMQHWINLARGEVGGLGMVNKVDNGGTTAIFSVRTVELLEQVAAPAKVQLDSMAEMAWMDVNHPGWRDKEDKPGVFFWHSHVDFPAFFSGQDEHAIRSLTAFGGMVVSVVGNKREEFEARVDFEIPMVGTSVTIPAEVRTPPLNYFSKEQLEELTAEYDAKVRIEAFEVKEWNRGLVGTIEDEIKALEGAAKGEDVVAQAAKRKIAALRDELEETKKKGFRTTKYEPAHEKGRELSKGYDLPPRRCQTCSNDLADWDGPEVRRCWDCRSGAHMH